MTHFMIALLTYAGFVLDVGFRQEWVVGGVAPEFLLVAMTVAAVSLGERAAILWAAAIGFLIDCISSGPLGITMFAGIIAVFAIRKILPRQSSYFLPAAIGISALLTFLVLLTSATARSLIMGQVIDRQTVLTTAIFGAGYTALVYTGLRALQGGGWRFVWMFVGGGLFRLPAGNRR